MKSFRGLATVLFLLILSGCASVAKDTEVMAEIKTGEGATIHLAKQEFVNHFKRLSGNGAEPQQVFERMVAEKLGLAEARRMNVGVEGSEVDEVVERIQESTGADLSSYEGFKQFAEEYHFESPEDLRRYLLEQLTLEKASLEHAGAGQIHARHILLGDGIDPNATEEEQAAAFQANKEKADEIYGRLQDGADFEQLAREFSNDPGSGEQGGDLGYIAKGRTVEPFENALFALAENEISQPVKTQFGWHIIQRLDARPDPQQTGEWLMQLYEEAQSNDRIDVKIAPEQAVQETASSDQ